MLHRISMKSRDMNITKIVSNSNIFIYFIPPQTSYGNMFGVHNMIHASLKFTNNSKDTAVSLKIFVKNEELQLGPTMSIIILPYNTVIMQLICHSRTLLHMKD